MSGTPKIIDEAVGSSFEREAMVGLEELVVAIPDEDGLELASIWVIWDEGRLGNDEMLGLG